MKHPTEVLESFLPPIANVTMDVVMGDFGTFVVRAQRRGRLRHFDYVGKSVIVPVEFEGKTVAQVRRLIVDRAREAYDRADPTRWRRKQRKAFPKVAA